MSRLDKTVRFVSDIITGIGTAFFGIGVIKNIPQVAITGGLIIGIATSNIATSRLSKALSYMLMWMSIPAGISAGLPSMWVITAIVMIYFFVDYMISEHPKRKWI